MTQSYKIALNFEDGVTRVIQCDADEKVVEAAFRQKVNLPMDCRDGVCGTCKCKAEFGVYKHDLYLEEAMTENEAAQGYVLTCQMMPRSDCAIAIPMSSMACKTGAQQTGAVLEGVDRISTTAFRLRITLDKPIDFLPGQYANIAVPGANLTRAYSYTSASGNQSASFLIRYVSGGIMSSYLDKMAKLGDRLSLTGPLGSFYLRDIVRPQLWIAGGTGLAPFLSMLETMAAQRLSVHPIHLVYAVTRKDDLVELDRIRDLQAALSNFRLTTIVSDPASAHERMGFATDHLTVGDLWSGNVDVYLCGPPPMVEAVRGHISKLGIVPASFRFEKFNPSDNTEAA